MLCLHKNISFSIGACGTTSQRIERYKLRCVVLASLRLIYLTTQVGFDWFTPDVCTGVYVHSPESGCLRKSGFKARRGSGYTRGLWQLRPGTGDVTSMPRISRRITNAWLRINDALTCSCLDIFRIIIII